MKVVVYILLVLWVGGLGEGAQHSGEWCHQTSWARSDRLSLIISVHHCALTQQSRETGLQSRAK